MTFKQKLDHELFASEQDVMDLEEEIRLFIDNGRKDAPLEKWADKLLKIGERLKSLQET